MSYFECNLPDVSPAYIHPTMSAAFTETLQRVKRRMAKLDDALEMTGMDGRCICEAGQGAVRQLLHEVRGLRR